MNIKFKGFTDYLLRSAKERINRGRGKDPKTVVTQLLVIEKEKHQ